MELSRRSSEGIIAEASFLMEESAYSRLRDWKERINMAVREEDANPTRRRRAVGPLKRLTIESIKAKRVREPFFFFCFG